MCYNKFEVMTMLTAPISELTNYNKILNQVSDTEDLTLTKNGKGLYTVVDYEKREREQAYMRFLEEMNRIDWSKPGNDYETGKAKLKAMRDYD
jgi:prevent-host-death family protein